MGGGGRGGRGGRLGGRFEATRVNRSKQVRVRTVRKHRVKVPRNKENTSASDLLVAQQKGGTLK